MTKAVDQLYDAYKDGAPGIGGWKLDRQIFEWAVPYHEGAIRYFKEKGVWTEAHQKHNDALVKRQAVLKAAWKEHAAKKIEDKEKAEAAWLKTRAARSEEHTSELQSLMRISYAVFCLKKKQQTITKYT